MIPPTWDGPIPGPSTMDNHNEAHPGAHIGQQVGAHYGDTAIHYAAVYHINDGDPPERRHDVARNFLAGGAPREAEEVFDRLLRDWHITTERAYYYFLSVVSERSFHDVSGELAERIIGVHKMCASLPHDEWSDAFAVVWRFMRFVRDEMSGESNTDLNVVLDAYNALPAERKDEIAQHLGMILSGMAKEKLEAVHAVRVVAERTSHGRAARAWKFFEPDPAKPRPYTPAPVQTKRGDLVGMVIGGGVVLIGVMAALIEPSAIGVLLGFPLVAVAGYLVLRHGGAREAVKSRNAAKAAVVAAPSEQPAPRSPGHWVSTAFVEEVHRLVDSRFSAARPHVAGDWPNYTAGIRAHLKQRFVELYGNARVPANAIGWLIGWHARQVAAGWSTQSLHGDRLAVPVRDTLLFRLGFLVGIAGLVVLLFANGALPALFVGSGGFFVVWGGMSVIANRGLAGYLRADAARLNAAESRAYQEWLALLADRPSDAEMARWLAMDKAYLRDNAVRRANLYAHDLVTHVVMTEGARGALRARVLHGPPRFSRYVVQIFLLTRGGVREARVELDFLTGDALNEQRHLFRYDALASASVVEKGLRGTRKEGAEVERLRSRAFQLSLVNGRDITVVAEAFTKERDDGIEEDDAEDESEQFRMSVQTSGIDAAMPVLEAVAAEGADWIARDRERRARWSRDWPE
ncbi:hypothetical protein [Saccharothrix obliqua]|uniref:hypothetical protein n=1 Tax=Saccharothrix obliqua TaxID=2861747 RepID=UPI001C5D91BB|nr:hypothetical protein [Saccharothrix obliqua]MBW4719986.1 hypothetical protein [Saccharothrix obliqua]